MNNSIISTHSLFSNLSPTPINEGVEGNNILNYFVFIPEIYLTISIIILLIYGVIYSKKEGIIKNQQKMLNISILTLLFTLLLIINIFSKLENTNYINICLQIDPLILFVKILLLISGILVLNLSKGVIIKKNEKIIDYEFMILILISILGMFFLISSKDFIVMYLSIETISLSFYILAAIRKSGQYSTEAGLKYFILGALSSGLLLFGSALIYISTGLLDFNNLAILLENTSNIEKNLIGFEIGAIFICIALFFKLAVAPFHMWAPDVYEGSPTIITAFFAIVPKISILLLLIHLIYGPFLCIFNSTIKPLLLISAIFSIGIGSLGALNQTKIKRLFAYSAIGHIGFIILGLVPGTINSLNASFIYIILYIIMSLNLFSLILLIFNKFSSNSFSSTSFTSSTSLPLTSVGSLFISELSGLSRKEPVLALTLALTLLSIAGIPPLAGFFSKYYVLLAIIESNYYLVSVIIILFSVIACFYYIRLIQFMYFKDHNSFLIKDLANISYSKVFNNFSSFPSSNTNAFFNRISGFPLPSILILGSTFYIILTFIFYPQPFLMFSFDSLVSSFL